MFECKCGESFKVPDSLQRHAKSCKDESRNSIEEDTQMCEGDSEALETLDLNEEEVNDTLTDCFGELIFLKLANCR
jgi:hypothetical protein